MVNVLESKASIRGTGENYLEAALGCTEKAKADPCAGWGNPMQQHRLRETSQEASSRKTWEAWWAETLEQIQKKFTKLSSCLSRECGVWTEELRAGLTSACNCNQLVGGERKSNQTLCTLQKKGSKHHFWVLKALGLSVMHYRFPAADRRHRYFSCLIIVLNSCVWVIIK